MKEFLQCVKNINKISKAYIKIGNVIVFTIIILVLFCSVSMGRFGNYDYFFYLKNDLLLCFKEMLGAVYVPALFLEILSIAKNCSI